MIPLDAAFSPVTRVRYKIEDTRVGQRTNYDKLILEVWTNGTVSPEMAVVESAKILRKHLNPFITYREPGPELPPEGGLRGMLEATGYAPVDLELEEKLGQSLAELNLSVRATNCLESEGINTVRDLVTRSRGPAAAGPQLRRDDVAGSPRAAGHDRPAAGNETAAPKLDRLDLAIRPSAAWKQAAGGG